MNKVMKAIQDSTSHNIIIHLPYDVYDYEELNRIADDSVRGNDETEFWAGTEEDGWRIHMALPEAEGEYEKMLRRDRERC